MDLGAYMQIGDLEQLAKANNIEVPRLRGYRLMKDEEPLSAKQIKEMAKEIGITEEKVKHQYDVFNKYAGKENILYIHARIGGGNWDCFGGNELTKQPWFLEKVDDCFDCTYCDIYAQLTKEIN